MSELFFYEKPGCVNNTKQKAVLREAGYQVAARSLLDHPWTRDSLRPFFGDRPVAAWFNPSAPRVKSGEVVPDALDERAALDAMLADPLLIRRPLIEFDGRREVGFDAEIERWLGLLKPQEDIESCPKMLAGEQNGCEVPTQVK